MCLISFKGEQILGKHNNRGQYFWPNFVFMDFGFALMFPLIHPSNQGILHTKIRNYKEDFNTQSEICEKISWKFKSTHEARLENVKDKLH